MSDISLAEMCRTGLQMEPTQDARSKVANSTGNLIVVGADRVSLPQRVPRAATLFYVH